MTIFQHAYAIVSRLQWTDSQRIEATILEELLAAKGEHGWTEAECEDAARWAAQKWGKR